MPRGSWLVLVLALAACAEPARKPTAPAPRPVAAPTPDAAPLERPFTDGIRFDPPRAVAVAMAAPTGLDLCIRDGASHAAVGGVAIVAASDQVHGSLTALSELDGTASLDAPPGTYHLDLYYSTDLHWSMTVVIPTGARQRQLVEVEFGMAAVAGDAACAGF